MLAYSLSHAPSEDGVFSCIISQIGRKCKLEGFDIIVTSCENRLQFFVAGDTIGAEFGRR